MEIEDKEEEEEEDEDEEAEVEEVEEIIVALEEAEDKRITLRVFISWSSMEVLNFLLSIRLLRQGPTQQVTLV